MSRNKGGASRQWKRRRHALCLAGISILFGAQIQLRSIDPAHQRARSLRRPPVRRPNAQCAVYSARLMVAATHGVLIQG